MRSSVRRPQSCRPADEPEVSKAAAGIGALIPAHGAHASPDFAAEVDRARRAARRHSQQAAMLLRSWMSEHD